VKKIVMGSKKKVCEKVPLLMSGALIAAGECRFRGRHPARPEEFQEVTMKRIERDVFYCGDEIKEILRGHVSLEALRAHGLVGLASGFWGSNVIDSIDAYIRSRGRTLDNEEQPTRASNGARSTRGKHVRPINFQDVIDMPGRDGVEHGQRGTPCTHLRDVPPGKSRPGKGV
ncbi:MAG: hypothetical protein DYH02_00905, partial [Candidatus Omnitrophica bacterium COP1]|nr:hypothetical protein [Candidatus Omnitrophica bacterium COP1]